MQPLLTPWQIWDILIHGLSNSFSVPVSPPLDLGCSSEKLKNSWQLFLESLYEFGLQPTEIPSQPQSIWQLTSPKSMDSIINFIIRVFSFVHCYRFLQYVHEQMCLNAHSVRTQVYHIFRWMCNFKPWGYINNTHQNKNCKYTKTKQLMPSPALLPFSDIFLTNNVHLILGLVTQDHCKYNKTV